MYRNLKVLSNLLLFKVLRMLHKYVGQKRVYFNKYYIIYVLLYIVVSIFDFD